MKPICLFDPLKDVLNHRFVPDKAIKAMVIVFPAAAEETLCRKDSTSGASVGCLPPAFKGTTCSFTQNNPRTDFILNRLHSCFISLITFLYEGDYNLG